MQAVRRLVGLDPDRSRLGAVDARKEVVEADVAELLRERVLEGLVPVSPERTAPRDEVLPRAALGLVQAQGRGGGEWRPLERGGDAVRVQAVPGLVHRRPERVEPGRVVARREPDVPVREGAAER